MADASLRFQQGLGQYFYHNHSRQPLQRSTSPINTRAFGYHTDLPSPTRSPGPQSPFNNMYNQGAHQNQQQHAMMNGAQRYLPMSSLTKQFQHQNHQHQGHQPQHHEQGHSAHGGPLGNHQHTISGGAISNTTPHFASNHIQNGASSTVHSSLNRPPSEHWALQIQLAQASREMTIAHAHARNHPTVNRSVIAGVNPPAPKEPGKEERNRGMMDNGQAMHHQEVWTSLDLGGQRLKALSRPLFGYTFLSKLYLNANNLSYLPPAIGQLRNLGWLDLSQNEIREVPAEIGMLVNLKDFRLFDNHIETLPFEMGSLYQLDFLGVEGNPLNDEFKSIIVEHGPSELIRYLREHAPIPALPNERPWLSLDDSDPSSQERFTVLSWNILCDRYCTQSQYGYTPSGALSWDHRKEAILSELRGRDPDIISLQEVDTDAFHHYFREALAHSGYKGVFWPKSRARTMAEKEAKLVDGCAIFFKTDKYILLDKQLIDYANMAINRPDMKGEHDIFNRVMPRDDIGAVVFLENRMTGSRLIVANTHVYWNPAYTDVKIVQVAILLEQVTKLAEKWAKWPPCTDKEPFRFANGDHEEDQKQPAMEPGPSLEYSSGPQIPLVMCGDYNSQPGSAVYNLVSQGSLSNSHVDIADFKYGNFTRDGVSHPFSLKSCYANIGELEFTNYTPPFTGVLDYVWYSTNALQVAGLLGDFDKEYLSRVPGFPNYHFPSDHVALQAELVVKGRKEKKRVEADFGQFRERRTG